MVNGIVPFMIPYTYNEQVVMFIEENGILGQSAQTGQTSNPSKRINMYTKICHAPSWRTGEMKIRFAICTHHLDKQF
jgi:hypothetical protein